VDGEIVAAAQEERFSRVKHDAGFPQGAVDYCLHEAGLDRSRIDYVGFYEKPLLKFGRLLETYLAFAPRGFRSFIQAMPPWLEQKLHLPREIGRGLGQAYGRRYIFTQHHESHAASAFFPSPFEEAAILTFDGVGEWATATWGVGKGDRLELLRELRFPHSLGLLYSAFTYFTGFKVNSDEYKLMGLAPYGEPAYYDLILEKLVDLREDGSFRLDCSYFDYAHGLRMTSRKFERLCGGARREPEAPITQREMDLAASVQKVTEEILLRSARALHAETGMRNLCMAGGVALNCVGNGRILREGPFEEVWIQPAADDAGGALGVALFIWHQLLGKPRGAARRDRQAGSLLGPSFGDAEIQACLDSMQAHYRRVDDDAALCDRVAGWLAAGQVVGWFQGRMEFGPRALGARSILGDARDPDMQSTINLKVKFREGFRPFAPAVLREHASDWFDMRPRDESPYMLLVFPVRDDKRLVASPECQRTEGLAKLQVQRSVIPAVTHVDASARLQTVDGDGGLYRRLLEAFHRRTGCPVLVNTSFNLGWDPIVCTPREAYETFMACDLDALCMGHFVLEKRSQPAWVDSAPARPAPAHALATVSSPKSADPVLDSVLRSPCCGAEMAPRNGQRNCGRCSHAFAIEGGIARLFWPHERIDERSDVTRRVQSFYEETPFPNYEDTDTLRSLIDKSRRGVYARCLDAAIPYNSTVLEIGCGTGQLSNYLGISCRRVIGTDLSLASLRLGEEFRRAQGLSRVCFAQMNLFQPAFRDGSFDVILCNGVLHHTSDPYGGLAGLVPLLKPGGHIVVGLYNRFGRLLTDLRRQVFKVTGGRAQWIDPILRTRARSSGQRHAWFADQYHHPHESKHTVGEVLSWFERCGLEFVRGVPSVTPGPDTLEGSRLFEPRPRGTALEHGIAQARQIVVGSREGGFFLMIGRKPGTPGAWSNLTAEKGA
jgi:carbamoyltransferase